MMKIEGAAAVAVAVAAAAAVVVAAAVATAAAAVVVQGSGFRIQGTEGAGSWAYLRICTAHHGQKALPARVLPCHIDGANEAEKWIHEEHKKVARQLSNGVVGGGDGLVGGGTGDGDGGDGGDGDVGCGSGSGDSGQYLEVAKDAERDHRARHRHIAQVSPKVMRVGLVTVERLIPQHEFLHRN